MLICERISLNNIDLYVGVRGHFESRVHGLSAAKEKRYENGLKRENPKMSFATNVFVKLKL